MSIVHVKKHKSCSIKVQKTQKFSIIADVSTKNLYFAPINGKSSSTRARSDLGDDFENSHDIYDYIFSEIPCELSCNVSRSDRALRYSGRDGTLTYGELASMGPIWKICQKLVSECKQNPNTIQRFYDLGSGSGRPTVAAALALKHFQSKENNSTLICTGIELLPGLYDLSLLAQERWENYYIHSIPAPGNLKFHLGSILDLTVCDWSDGDLVYVTSTCFSVSMMLKVHDIATHMKVGSIIITLSRSMIEIEALAKNIRDKCVATVDEPPTWQLLFETREQMSW